MELNGGIELAAAANKKFFVVNSSSSSSRNNDNEEDGFRKRQSSVFDILNDLEAKHTNEMAILRIPNHEDNEDEEDEEEDGCNAVTTRFQKEITGNDVKLPVATQSPPESTLSDEFEGVGKIKPSKHEAESFKVPIGVPAKKRNCGNGPSSSFQTTQSSVPSYVAHPEKWTKYTLTDVDDEQMSESANSAAATEFLSSRPINKGNMDDCLKEDTLEEEPYKENGLEDDEEESKRPLTTNVERHNFIKKGSIVRRHVDTEKGESVSTSRLSFVDRDDETSSSRQSEEEEPKSCRSTMTIDNLKDNEQKSARLFRVVGKKNRNIRRQTSEVAIVDDDDD